MDELDNLDKQVSQLYDKQYEQQQNIINTSTQQAVDELERNKQKAQQEADKTNKALYTDYQKQVNPYGVNAENLYEQGLAKSGLAETTKANYYNTYQNARSEAQSNADNIKADFDAQIARARQNGDLQLAESALQMYTQKINDLYNMYNLNYQRQRDDLTQSNWQKEYERAMAQDEWNRKYQQQNFDYNKSIDDRNYNYQLGRDKIADQQWQQQYDYNKAIADRNYNYQVSRDATADKQWQQQYDYNKAVNDRNYNYQVGRDAVADKQWQQQYDYNKEVNDRNYNYQKEINDRNYNYQVNRDAVADNQWQTQFDYNRAINDRNYNYQLERDAIADEQWQQQYELSKKNSVGRSSGRSYSSGSNSTNNSIDPDEIEDTPEVRELRDNVLIIERPGGASTLAITPNATREQVLRWGNDNGVDLSRYDLSKYNLK